MSKRTSISDITEYLVRVKKLLSEGKYDFVPRRKICRHWRGMVLRLWMQKVRF